MSDKEQERRWAEHFDEVLNRDNPSDLPHIQEAPEHLDINVEPPTKEEMFAAIKEPLSAELFKTHPELASKLLLLFFVTIWKDKSIREDWCKGTIVKMPKKGDLTNRNNWRGVTLSSVTRKIVCKIIVKRLSAEIDKSAKK